MIEDMIAVMRRINDLQKRFGLKRHNPEINLQNKNNDSKGKSYLKTHNESINKVVKSGENNDGSNIKINKLNDQYSTNFKISKSPEVTNNGLAGTSKNGIKDLMNLLPGNINEYSGGGSLYSPEILTKGMNLFNNLLKGKSVTANKGQNDEMKLNFNKNKVDKINGKKESENIKNGIDSYLRNRE